MSLFRVFGKVAAKSQIPLISMYVFSFLAAVLAVLLDIETLVEMMSIGTLSAYLIVSGGVLIFRYRPNQILKVVVLNSLFISLLHISNRMLFIVT